MIHDDFQVHTSPEKDKSTDTTPKPEKTEIKKHSIVKIDPKTLKPITEKAPESTSLSAQSDLKINTSSVPIFQPLKLQGSPKNDRKSPKSPHSPKLKTASPPNKREKLNLNFTPPNPFIPNLASPTVSPSQFFYPSGPPGFPSYDPRFMAAYHTLLYGQRMPFSPSPLQSSSRKPFELPSAPSLKMPSQLSPKNSVGPSSPKLSGVSSNSKSIAKKSAKDGHKPEKSLQNAVEKLTQNRAKETKKNEESMTNAKTEDNNKSETVKDEGKSQEKSVELSDKLQKSDKDVDTGTNLDNGKLSNNNSDTVTSLVTVESNK